MKKIWLIFKHEYLRHVLRKRFIFAVLSIPFFVLLSGGISVLAVLMQSNSLPIGYVDLSGWLAHPVMPEKSSAGLLPSLDILPFPNENTANASLLDKKIQGYYIISKDYLTSQQVQVVANDSSFGTTNSQFSDFLRFNLISSFPKETADRLIAGSQTQVESLNNDRRLSANNWMSIVLPILAGVMFIVAINMSGGYLLQSVVEEKENRTMEIVVTSVSPNQLMAGKILGNLSVGLTQLFIWFSFPILGLLIARLVIPSMLDFQIDTAFFLLLLFTLLPAFVLVAALMAALGATVTDSREGQQIAGLFTLPIVMPFWFMGPIMNNPNGVLAVAFSIFPLTAPISLPLRAAFTTVPLWQILAILALLYASALGAIWLAGKTFRIGMLQYGKRLSIKDILRRL
jgi:ABC-2 type transport system permease protein